MIYPGSPGSPHDPRHNVLHDAEAEREVRRQGASDLLGQSVRLLLLAFALVGFIMLISVAISLL
jgi:hypothetical protein